MSKILWATLVLALSGCGFVTGQLKDKADEERLLKPGALDVPIASRYRTYSYKFLGKYKITHDWTFAGSCQYGSVEDRSTGKTVYTGDILEVGENIYVDRESQSYPIDSRYPKGTKNLNLDRFVHPEWQSTDGKGKILTRKGFTPICAQGWVGTSHSLSINLVKLSLSDAIKRYTEPAVPLQEVQIGGNAWIAQNVPLIPREINTIAGSFLSWLLPVKDTGYTLVFELGANQDSLKHPEAHARMQEIFRHLVESVKIEPIDAKNS